jgi:HSP20 family protein
MFWSDMNRISSTWDPWRELDRTQRLFREFTSPSSAEFPAVNVWSNGSEAVLTAEIPGIDPKMVDISVVGKIVTIRGSRQPEPVKENEAYHRQERWSGQFNRTIDLPFAIDAGRVEAKFSRGVLTVTLPRTEADKPRKITVVSE